MTIREAAAVLRCTEWHVRSLVNGGKLGAFRLGKRSIRILPSVLEDFMRTGGVKVEQRPFTPAPAEKMEPLVWIDSSRWKRKNRGGGKATKD